MGLRSIQVLRRTLPFCPTALHLLLGGTFNFSVARRSCSSTTTDTVVSRSRAKLPGWTTWEWDGKLEEKRQIFCNRTLNMKSILAVGFDMDYTLAQYKPETFESLAYEGTIKKLVYNLGYPRQILDWKFDWQYMVRGLVLDKRRGNILKMDRHKYVKVAYHGFKELSREERSATYGSTLSRESYDEPDYALIDTLFSLAEAYLFAQLVELKDASPELFPPHPEVYCEDNVAVSANYAQIYKDVRAAVDLCHRDGTVKQAVADEPGKYIYCDQQLFPMLQMLRDSGRMTFLVTNSLWDYTHVVMKFLYSQWKSEPVSTEEEWLKFFDVIVTGSGKPSFFMDGNRAPLFEVETKTGLLQNTDNGIPLVQVGGISSARPQSKPTHSCRVFQGGSVGHLHRLLSIEAGGQVMYVGDHIYGDILRSKKELGWRTMLIVPELEKELSLLHENSTDQTEFQRLRRRRGELQDELQRLDWHIRRIEDGKEELLVERDCVQAKCQKVSDMHRMMQKKQHEKFHRIWGQVMKAGYQNSRFAHQVERFACLYTSQVTNLCYYSPDKCFRTSEDLMPHELENVEFHKICDNVTVN